MSYAGVLNSKHCCIYILEVLKLYLLKHFIQLTNHKLPKHQLQLTKRYSYRDHFGFLITERKNKKWQSEQNYLKYFVRNFIFSVFILFPRLIHEVFLQQYFVANQEYEVFKLKFAFNTTIIVQEVLFYNNEMVQD